MKTSRAFSTISYNSIEFLQLKLGELVTKRYISFYAFVYHYPEKDEKKAHIHLHIIPNGLVNTDQIDEYLKEYDPINPTLPLGCMPWWNSKWADWYLYSIHDVDYLKSKGQTRQYHYKEEDVISSNTDYLHELVSTIDRTKYTKTKEFVNKIKNGNKFFDMVCNGEVPIAQFNQWKNMRDYMVEEIVYRNGKATHTPKDEDIIIDEETGEVLPKNRN